MLWMAFVDCEIKKRTQQASNLDMTRIAFENI
jgi:hypothetical protein